MAFFGWKNRNFGFFQDMLEFPAQELRKYFRMGDHVKVIAGRFEGDTGLIVRVEENFVILFSDLTMHEMGMGEKMGKTGKTWESHEKNL